MTKMKKSWLVDQVDLNEITSYSVELSYIIPSGTESIKKTSYETLDLAIAKADDAWARLNKEWWMLVTYSQISLKKLYIPFHKINFLRVTEVPPSERHQDISSLIK